MSEPVLYNVYCDESCHLPNDGQSVMVLGAAWCPHSEARRLGKELWVIKERHAARGELKWSKTSEAKMAFYTAVVDWFLDEPALHFRGLIVQHKQDLNHVAFNEGDADLFYYKMQFSLLNKILSPENRYAIYLDVKDTRSRDRLRKLREVLCNNVYDFTSEMIGHIQNVRSDEVPLVQVADYLAGALSYRHRGLGANVGKVAVIQHLEARLGRSLLQSTPLREEKLNIFLFSPRKVTGT